MPQDDTPQKPPLGRLGWAAIIALGAMLGGIAWFVAYGWSLFPGTEIGTHGVIAMVLGIVLSTALGVGLMALLFWSNRKGYDR